MYIVVFLIPFIFNKALIDYFVIISELNYLKTLFINIKVELC